VIAMLRRRGDADIGVIDCAERADVA
jgi:hypothetical protein